MATNKEPVVISNGTTKITLQNDLQINGVKIPAGSQEVPSNVAEDWVRMDREAEQEKADHHRNQNG